MNLQRTMQQFSHPNGCLPFPSHETSDNFMTMRDLSPIVTIVVVTSPIASNPNTEMIDRCIAGAIRSFPPLNTCKIVIACDGVGVIDSVPKQQRGTTRIFGKCTKETFDRYDEFCHKLSARKWLQVDRQLEWRGFALSLRSALKSVETPIVMVLPHDYELTPDSLEYMDVSVLLQTMLASTDINYIGLPNPRSSKIRSRHSQALQGLSNRSIHVGGKQEIQMEPIAMWKENPHFAKVEAYRSIVFSRHYKRGQFIEDTLGQDMLTTIKERGVDAFLHTYLLSLDKPCSFHMDGPRYLPITERQKRHYSVQQFEIDAAERAHHFVTEKSRDCIGT